MQHSILLLRQNTLGRRNLPCSALINLTSFPQGPCKGFERSLNNVMRVLASKLSDVQSHAARVDNRLEKMLYQLCVIAANVICRYLQIVT